MPAGKRQWMYISIYREIKLYDNAANPTPTNPNFEDPTHYEIFGF